MVTIASLVFLGRLLFSGYQIYERRPYIRKSSGVIQSITVARRNKTRHYDLTIQFRDNHNNLILFETEGNAKNYKGETVPVVYDLRKPTRAEIADSSEKEFMLQTMYTIFASIIAMFGWWFVSMPRGAIQRPPPIYHSSR